ncbi:MAG: PQQ-binding-like beta-propeller repeat protein [bacterium]
MKKSLLLACSMVLVLWGNGHARDAREVLETAGVEGGLVVVVGWEDPRLLTGLRANDSYLVHGLDADAERVASARAHIRSAAVYGPVSVARWDAAPRLPYVDRLVKLLVIAGEEQVPAEEVRRVLAPGGVVVTEQDGTWAKTVAPWPEEIDEWTHDLHDPGGNPVGDDSVVGPPYHLQWKAGPLWARSHGYTPSVSAMVSAHGRLFAICDETLACVDDTVPSQWRLVARDAFSGVLLWKRPVPDWGARAFSGTANTGRGVTVGRFTMPPHVGKRLVAVGDTVYVTLGAAAPVSALDAASGKTRRVYAATTRADELLVADGRLLVSINPPPKARPPVTHKGQQPEPPPGKHVCAVEASTGRVLWKRGPFTGVRCSRGQDPFGRLELSAHDGRVFFLTAETIECVAADSGETVWRTERPDLPGDAVRKLGFAGMYEYLLTVMVVHDGVVLLAQPEPNTHHTYHTMPGTLYAFDAKDGSRMWEHAYGGWGHCTQPDVFVVDGVVWTHVDAETEYGRVWGNGYRAKNPAKVDYRIQALDLRTGEQRRTLPTRDIFTVGHHHRCYRNRSTERFLLSSRRGVEFVDLTTGQNYQNHWVRSGCLQGNLPCNGLVYVAPHPCACYIDAKIKGFNALAPRGRSQPPEPTAQDERLERGPAYGQVPQPAAAEPRPGDWPTYRHDARRSGHTEEAVPTELAVAWEADIGTPPSPPVVAGGTVFVAGVDTHTVHALKREDGARLWSYTAGGRVHCPPTIYRGMAIFSSADGRVHAVRASDGTLVWRFQAAPRERLLCAFGQLESPWPVPGVLVQAGTCWFAAGRCSYMDGGICVYALDAATGKVKDERTISHRDPETGIIPPVSNAHSMTGLLNDIPGSNGSDVFIRQMKVWSGKGGGGPHLYTTGGFLDSNWFNRTFWKFHKAQTSGVMVLGADAVYGMEVYPSRSRETVFKPGSNPYRLRCFPFEPRSRDQDGGADGPRRVAKPKPAWEQRMAIRGTAMVCAGDVVFVAGSPDVVDPEDPHGAWEGRKGGVLAAVSAAEGERLAQHKLPSAPIWDGLAAAHGALFVSGTDGKVLCIRSSR